MEISQIGKKLNDLEEERKELKKSMEMTDWLQSYNGEDRVVSISELMEELEEERKRPVFSLNSDMSSLDKIIGGFREGQLIIISAETGQGKTTYCQTLTNNFEKNGAKCLWFSYEVGIMEFIDKFVNLPAFYLPRLIKQNKLLWLETKIKEGVAKFDCNVVFIDHLHYLLEMQKMAEAKSISLLVGMMMRELKRIAIENKIIIFLVSHMRKIQTSEMPEIDDLRDSSFVGQESDIVIFLKRKKIKDKEGRMIETNETLLRVAKNRRTGALGYVPLIFIDGKFQEVENNYDINPF